jgi:cell division septal protein FtsQ
MRKNRNVDSSKKRAGRNPVPLVIKLAAVLFVFSTLAYGVCAFAKLSFFTIKEIKVKDNHEIDVSGIQGKNIFCLDLNRVGLLAMRRYPQYSGIRILRILPDRIYVDFSARKPLAGVNLGKTFLVDESGFFFSRAPLAAGEAVPELPLIEGLDGRLRSPLEGRRHSLRELRFALDFIKEASVCAGLKNFTIKSININPSSGAVITFLKKGQVVPAVMALPSQRVQTQEGVQVKVGAERVADKIGILATILNQYFSEFSTISYIDLRFKEPVIKFRDAQTKKEKE